MPKDPLTLPPKPTLRNYQQYVAKMIKLRGFDRETVPEMFMLLSEECGELAKAVRKQSSIHIDKNSKEYDIGHEAADIFIYLIDICNHFSIDLEKAFREKEKINKKRTWHKAT